jgi:hypothetical protein
MDANLDEVSSITKLTRRPTDNLAHPEESWR